MPKQGRIFIALTALLVLISCFFLFVMNKGELHLAFDHFHLNSNPTFFRYFTYMGDGLAFVIVVLGLIALRKPRKLVFSFAFTGVIVLFTVSFLKGVFFSDIARPWGYFEAGSLRVIPGLDQHTSKSFPSGHTMAAFALYGLMSFWISAKRSGYILCMVAAAVGYSRIYLNQHFLVDVTVGATLGTFIAWGVYSLFQSNKWSERLNKPIW